ncbi:hypothetical protein [Pseudomonas fluorescens]|uniref:hypothetical protein n=1 Tax=Pseudomonas fluorescens TaxID=294 RepID=UPI001786FEF1|nr:hypothetical protein [Pseudomonas fluorescens]
MAIEVDTLNAMKDVAAVGGAFTILPFLAVHHDLAGEVGPRHRAPKSTCMQRGCWLAIFPKSCLAAFEFSAVKRKKSFPKFFKLLIYNK